MVLPIIAYGDPILRKKTALIEQDYPHLTELIENMFDTMYDSNGVGLAAPQIGKSIRMFVVDCRPFAEDEDNDEEKETLENFKKIFINPKKIETFGDDWKFTEGCLSIPNIHEDVTRPDGITLTYLDENFVEHTESFTGLPARVIQHEYDHLDGKLFIDYLSSFKKKLISNKLKNISKGNISVHYKMKFPS
ncbi:MULTISPECIES: peptide deformylase [Weeksella]|uniref:Peptide deformylase n=1 Tax=Weeksella virosa (strain ATCC 43766 / DSM 16922 / JCM 21250 / CCUG 30538 / CDC 9751 / IAM 14551 / NBRC 16016 / NCTC 11634 / CL345/78) TaxID=865938 RepID=F0P117_WEEVC|nr:MULTISPECIES: peptide deformylase [Weeksella]ADX68601.1 Peptide deformylase [Weeksella virosa DSM 16922]MDK7375182.1 peptide deformylase [Weeksella virosa]MDK7675224.1 peptide deformylase [Weeksella virosa]OFM85680.1 peptide deformylase [Weeksella sp. HMSC059D05]SUP54941.1 Peptide deformylase [Weeksella virosa]